MHILHHNSGKRSSGDSDYNSQMDKQEDAGARHRAEVRSGLPKLSKGRGETIDLTLSGDEDDEEVAVIKLPSHKTRKQVQARCYANRAADRSAHG